MAGKPTPSTKTAASYNLKAQQYDVFNLASLYLRTAGFPDTPTNRRLMAAWFWSESQHAGNTGVTAYNNNPLNITTSGSNYHQFAGNTLKFANYATPQEGAQAWSSLLASNPRYLGIMTALRNQDYALFPSAVGGSPWGTSGSTVKSSYNYFQHFATDATGNINTQTWAAANANQGAPLTFGQYTNISYPTGTVITQKMLNDIASSLWQQGAFGTTDPTNLTGYATSAKAEAVFQGDMQQYLGKVWNTQTLAAMGQSVPAAGVASDKANPLQVPDLTGINNFFGSLSKNNVLFAALIPAGAILMFYGLHMITSAAGVTGKKSNGGGSGSTTVIQTRQYPVLVPKPSAPAPAPTVGVPKPKSQAVWNSREVFQGPASSNY